MKKALRSDILELLQHAGTKEKNRGKPSISLVQESVRKILIDDKLASEIDGNTKGSLLGAKKYKIPGQSRVNTRIMLSRYLDTHSLFAMDLAAAVVRQFVFTEKMDGSVAQSRRTAHRRKKVPSQVRAIP